MLIDYIYYNKNYMSTNHQLTEKTSNFTDYGNMLHKYCFLTVLFKKWSGTIEGSISFDNKMDYWKTAFGFWDPTIMRSGSGPTFKFPYGRGIPGFMKELKTYVCEIENSGKDITIIDKNIKTYLQKSWNEIREDVQYKNSLDTYIKKE